MEKDETMKCIVETTGSFTLINTTSEAILNNRPCVTTNTNFIDVQINKGKLKVLARGLPRKAEDLEFNKVLRDSKGDAKLAIEAFCAEHGVTTEGEAISSEDLEGKAAEEAAAEEAKKAKEAEDAEKAKKAKEAEDAEVAKRVAEAEEANKKLEEEKNNDKNSESTSTETEKSDGTADKTDAGKEDKKGQGKKGQGKKGK